MSIENTNCRVQYDGNDVRVDFPTTFAFVADGDLVVETSADGVTWTAQTLGDQYEVSGASDPEPGGTVTFGVALATGTTVRITRETPITQESELQTSGPLPAKVIISDFDKLTMICQELRRDVAALQALGDLVTVAQLANGTRFSGDFTTDANAVEATFPFNIAVANGQNAVDGIVRVFKKSDASQRFDTSPFVQWKPGAIAGTVTVLGVDGLEVGTTYTLKALFLF